jgi:uncharacterized protein YqgC (DUF456 family)
LYHEITRRYDARVMEASVLLWVLAIGLMVTGLAGTVLPFLPGPPLMLLGMFIAAWSGHFTRIGPWMLSILAVLTLLAVAVDLVAAALGARRVGASRQAVLGAAVGTVVGIFFGIAGLILGPFVGAVAGELLARRQLTRVQAQAAVNVGIGAWIGFVIGTVAKLAVAFTMLGVFVAAWYLN